jgi:hypothetical protein
MAPRSLDTEISGLTSRKTIQEKLTFLLSDQKIVGRSWSFDPKNHTAKIVFESVKKVNKLFGIGSVGLFDGSLQETVVEILNSDSILEPPSNIESDLFVSDVDVSADALRLVSGRVEILIKGHDLRVEATQNLKFHSRYRILDLGVFDLSW